MNEVAEKNHITRNEDGTVTVVAANGKRITVRRPHVLSQYRLVEALGGAAENSTYLRMCAPLLWVSEIDGVEVLTPASKLQVEALITRLDEAGITAVSEALESHFAQQDVAAAAKK